MKDENTKLSSIEKILVATGIGSGIALLMANDNEINAYDVIPTITGMVACIGAYVNAIYKMVKAPNQEESDNNYE